MSNYKIELWIYTYISTSKKNMCMLSTEWNVNKDAFGKGFILRKEVWYEFYIHNICDDPEVYSVVV